MPLGRCAFSRRNLVFHRELKFPLPWGGFISNAPHEYSDMKKKFASQLWINDLLGCLHKRRGEKPWKELFLTWLNIHIKKQYFFQNISCEEHIWAWRHSPTLIRCHAFSLLRRNGLSLAMMRQSFRCWKMLNWSSLTKYIRDSGWKDLGRKSQSLGRWFTCDSFSGS